MLQMFGLTNLQVYNICVFGITSQDVRVQILIWSKTFLLFTNPIFRLLMHCKTRLLMHCKTRLFRHFRLFQTLSDFFSQMLSHPCCIQHLLLTRWRLVQTPEYTRARVFGKYVLFNKIIVFNGLIFSFYHFWFSPLTPHPFCLLATFLCLHPSLFFSLSTFLFPCPSHQLILSYFFLILFRCLFYLFFL